MVHDLRAIPSAKVDDPAPRELEFRGLTKVKRLEIPTTDLDLLGSGIAGALEDLAARLRELRRRNDESVVSRLHLAAIHIGACNDMIKADAANRRRESK